jgi:uncharacterized protein (DUF697 family)
MSDREKEALKIVKTHMWMSAGAGLIPIPVVDLAAVAGVQLKTLATLSKFYEVPFTKNCGKAAISSLIGFVLPHAMAFGAAGSFIKLIPFVGTMSGVAWMGLFSGAYTWALGNVFIQHFESGGTFLNFNAEKVKDHFQTKFKEGQKMAASMGKAEQTTDSAKSKAN